MDVEYSKCCAVLFTLDSDLLQVPSISLIFWGHVYLALTT